MDVCADTSSNIINIDDDHVMSCWVRWVPWLGVGCS